MSNIGYREVMDYGVLSLKQLNDNLRALWSKVMGDIEYRDLSPNARAVIESKVDSDDLTAYSTVEQTAEAIRAEVGRVDESLARLTIMAEEITAQVASVDGDMSEIRQSASELSSTVLNLSGAVSQVQQTASGLYLSVSGLTGRVSALEQTDASVAVKLKDDAISTSFEARIAQSEWNPYATWREFGLYLYLDGLYLGGLWADTVFYGLGVGSGSRQTTVIGQDLWLIGRDGQKIIIGNHTMSGQNGIICQGHVLPDGGNTYDLGGDGNGMRWRRIYSNNSLNTSDERAKHDIAPLNAADLLMRLEPIRYRMNDEPDGQLRFGLGANAVREALKGSDYEDAALLYAGNPDLLHLNYTELIAVLVEGYQQQQRRIEALEAIVLEQYA